MTEISKTEGKDDEVFRYVSCEMSAQEETRFEDRLANDQDLRERVAAMVCTLSAIDRVFAESTETSLVSPVEHGRPKKVKRSLIKIVASLAAMILLAALAISMIANPLSSEPEQIAIAWAESLDTDEFEILDHQDEFEILPVSFESDSDWIYDVVDATQEDAAI